VKRRLKKKLLRKAIRELNNDVTDDFGFERATESEVSVVYKRLKDDKKATANTLRDYEKLILWKKRNE